MIFSYVSHFLGNNLNLLRVTVLKAGTRTMKTFICKRLWARD